MYQEAYYFTYFGLCVALIVALARTFRRSGAVFLADVFGGNQTLVRAVAQMLDVGFYLVSFGYVAVSSPNYEPLHNFREMGLMITGKAGAFLLLLGFVHFFNLLLLAIFRQRSTRIARTGVLS